MWDICAQAFIKSSVRKPVKVARAIAAWSQTMVKRLAVFKRVLVDKGFFPGMDDDFVR